MTNKSTDINTFRLSVMEMFNDGMKSIDVLTQARKQWVATYDDPLHKVNGKGYITHVREVDYIQRGVIK